MFRKQILKKISGFSLPEILLTFAIISIISGIALPMYLSLSIRNELDVSVNTIAQTLRRAQTLSRAGAGDSSWGVRVDNGQIILFRGTSFATRNQNFDEAYNMQGSISVTGTNEFVFSKLTGLLQSTNTVILTTTTNEERQITVNTKGTVEY